MPQKNNINIESTKLLASPAQVKEKFPSTPELSDDVHDSRVAIENILERKDKRHIMVVGPCSIHNIYEAIDYAERLKKLSDEVKDKILLVMRVYFEKPRTTVGWKGLIYDPELHGSYDIEKGIHLARELLIKIVEMGIPVGTEVLDPVITQYIADLISWSAIGARTTESQTHRQLVSGLSMPTGFKNGTDSSIKVAIEAVKTAKAKHSFIGVTNDGRTGLFRTKGNNYSHVILRGGNSGPNYGSEYIAFTRELMKKAGLTPNIMVDCSHANSGKIAAKQLDVMRDLISQIKNGESDIIGSMLESNIVSGSQKVIPGKELVYGLSITDECIGWEETENIIKEFYRSV